ncbi:MAG: hypothetical protein FWC96_04260 [Oscillospiraceae bacterium]|nr:hypothetical protein [Oscillospiraceae bacterium]
MKNPTLFARRPDLVPVDRYESAVNLHCGAQRTPAGFLGESLVLCAE